jgi:putative tricarboxylic transport membrane protein
MVSRFSAEIATAIITAVLGLTVMIGAWEFGIGWSSSGPGAGAFPFYVGLVVTLASIGTIAKTALARSELQTVFLDRQQARRVASFFGPMVLFVVAALALGLYVAAALYLTVVMWLQGGYRLVISAPAGIAAAIFFYVVLELAFQVPLMKGPLEASLGIH